MIIGITGGAGSGKSQILKFIKDRYSATVIEADSVAKELMLPQSEAFDLIVSSFGKEILIKKGGEDYLDRAKLSDIVFSDEEKLKLLNSIVHPFVKKKIDEIISSEYAGSKDSLIVIESAILVEAGYLSMVDELWFVFVKKEIRIKRLMESRNYTIEKCEMIFANQLSDSEFAADADFIIDNSESFGETARQIEMRLGAQGRG